MTEDKYLAMDLGFNPPTSVPMDTIEVEVDCGDLVGDYARAFIQEMFRVNPALAERESIDEDQLLRYFKYLLQKRIECVNDECKDFRRLKVLFIPSYFQFVLRMIGEVIDRDMGLRMIPVLEEPATMSYDEALLVSNKISAFETYLQVVQDAMPRDRKGDINVMSTALISGYVRSYRQIAHPAATVVTAFLDMKLRKDIALSALYRIQYDDLAFIQAAFTSQRGLFH